MNAQSKHISQIALPGIDPQATDSTDNGTGTNSDYLEKLKAKTDKIAETLVDIGKYEYGIKESYRLRLDAARQAKAEFGDDTTLTKKELDYCFPGCEHPEQRQEPPNQPPVENPKSQNNPPTSQQAEQRLEKPPQSQDTEYELTAEDWEWLEKRNHELGGRLDYASGFTPQMLELDIKFNLSNHRTRLYMYASLHCTKKTGITSRFTIEFLAGKLQCSRRDIREAMKDLRKMGLALPNLYPKHYTKDFTFILPYVKQLAEVSKEIGRIEALTGKKNLELWNCREELGYVVKGGGECEGEAEAEGVRPPSS